MNELTVLAAVIGLVMLFVVAEIAAAVLPLILVVALVPPEQRRDLADVLAACDSSRKLRLWSALRAAVQARRRHTRDRNLNPQRDKDGPFHGARLREPEINRSRAYDPDIDRPDSPAGHRRFD